MNIADNDYHVKINKIKHFIDEGDRVKVTLFLRGREMSYQDLAINLMENILKDVSEFAVTSDKIQFIGNCISLNFSKK